MIKKRLIISQTAASANILKYYSDKRCLYYLKGPARKIFNKKAVKKNIELKNSLSKINCILLGTNSESKIELELVQKARDYNIKTIFILEHWYNLRKRFYLNNKKVSPTEIWVYDKKTYLTVKKFFFRNNTKIILKRNPYIKYLKNKIVFKKKNKIKKNCLYLCGSIFYHKDRIYSKTEKDSLNSFLNSVNFFLNNNYLIKVRKHPTDNYNSFVNLIKNKRIRISNSNNLEHDLNWADYVIGANTIALDYANYVGKKTFSSIINKKKNIQNFSMLHFSSLFKKIKIPKLEY